MKFFFIAIYRNNTRSNLRVTFGNSSGNSRNGRTAVSSFFKRIVTDIALEYFSSIFFFFLFLQISNHPFDHRNDTDGVDVNRSVSSPRKISLHKNSKVDIGSRTFTQRKFYVTCERPFKKLVHNYRMSRIRLVSLINFNE